jgi:DNA relaxase NicK
MQDVTKLRAKIKRFKQLYQKISDMITEQERIQQISRSAFEEDTREFDRDKYLMAQSNIANRIMEYQEKVMNLEIEYGLTKDYE